MKVFFTLALFVTLFSSLSASAQWMNNDYPLDSVDVQKALDMMGFSIFKFPFSVPPGKKMYLNYVVEIYEDGELVKTVDHYQALVKASLPSSIIAGSMMPLDTVEQYIRVYWKEDEANYTRVNIACGQYSYQTACTLDTTKFRMADCRAMTISTKQLTERIPVAVRYSHYVDQDVISCPGRVTVDQIRNLYGSVIALYFEPIEIPDEITEK